MNFIKVLNKWFEEKGIDLYSYHISINDKIKEVRITWTCISMESLQLNSDEDKYKLAIYCYNNNIFLFTSWMLPNIDFKIINLDWFEIFENWRV